LLLAGEIWPNRNTWLKIKMILLTGLLLLHTATATTASRNVVFVKQNSQGITALLSELQERSDPSSQHFLSWLNKDDVDTLLQPSPDHLRSILDVAEKHGAHTINRLGGAKLEVLFQHTPQAFINEANQLPGVDFVASDSSSNQRFDVTLASVKRSFHRNATATVATTSTNNADPQACLGAMLGVTPTCLRAAYGLDNSTTTTATTTATTTTTTTGGQAFVVNQAFASSDLSRFQQEFNLPSNPIKTIVGPNSGKAGDEASLDSQYITTTGQNIDTTFVYIDGSMDNPFTDWLVWAGNATDAELPKVHSLSVGAAESEVSDTIIARMNTEMAALGVRGVTIVFASGDGGYSPVLKYGASSPYVLSVGGIFNGELRNSPLQADSLTTGGFSSSALNKAQPWQAAAIASYTKNRKPSSLPKTIPVGRRAVPDVSAYDDDLSIVQNGQDSGISGTSAACPIVAGMLAKINEALVQAGHDTSLGFVNPFVYANEALFLDITKGDNRGIFAVPGYDPISGVGTFSVNTFEGLKEAAIKALERVAVLKKREI
jgi:subtilase family serine protease